MDDRKAHVDLQPVPDPPSSPFHGHHRSVDTSSAGPIAALSNSFPETGLLHQLFLFYHPEHCLGRLNDHGTTVQLIDKSLFFRIESMGESFLYVKRKVSAGYGDFKKGYGGKVGDGWE